MVATNVADQLKDSAFFEALNDEFRSLFRCLASLDTFVEENLQGSGPTGVLGHPVKLRFNGVEHFLNLCARALSEQHLTEEVCEWVHHKLIEARVLK